MRNERLGTKRGIRGGPAAQSITFSFEENGSHQHNYESVPLSHFGESNRNPTSQGILLRIRIRSAVVTSTPMNPKEILPILKETASDWMEDQAPTLGAALAYYTVFSLAPLLIIAIAIAGLVLGKRPPRVKSSSNCEACSARKAGKRCRIWFRTRMRSRRPVLLQP